MDNPWFVSDADLLTRLKPDDLDVLQRLCPFVTHQQGDVLYRQGDQAQHLHIILEGHVKLTTYSSYFQEQVLVVLGPNDFVGESFLAEHTLYRANAVITSPTALTCPISRHDYLQLACRAPHFVLSFTEVLASHLASCHDQLGITAYPLQVRVAHALLEEARRFGRHETQSWVQLERNLIQAELAARVNATRVSVTEVMSNLYGFRKVRAHFTNFSERSEHEKDTDSVTWSNSGCGSRWCGTKRNPYYASKDCSKEPAGVTG